MVGHSVTASSAHTHTHAACASPFNLHACCITISGGTHCTDQSGHCPTGPDRSTRHCSQAVAHPTTKPSAASMATRPWVISASRQRLMSEMRAVAANPAGSNTSGKGALTPGRVLRSADGGRLGMSAGARGTGKSACCSCHGRRTGRVRVQGVCDAGHHSTRHDGAAHSRGGMHGHARTALGGASSCQVSILPCCAVTDVLVNGSM